MSAAFVPSWPGGRVLLGWWRALADRKPRQVRLSRLLIHHVEALVRVRRVHLLDRWQRALLGLANTRLPVGGALLNSLTDLQMDLQILSQLVRELTERGLLHRNGSDRWWMTPAGRDALQTGMVSLVAEERRTFPFVDNSALGRPPHFLPLSGARPLSGFGPTQGSDVLRSEDYPFEVVSLEACIRQTPEWKSRFRFPSDVEALLPPQPGEAATANWRRVLLDAVEQRPFVFIHTAQTAGQTSRLSSASPHLLGFAVHPEGWALSPRPLLELADGWEEALPDLAVEPSPSLWRQAWQTWSQPRSLPQAEVAACRLERIEHRLLVYAPPRLIERLRAARSDAIKQEAWLLAGEGRTRTAAQIELHPL
jgi:hypothetical protein